MRVSTRNCRKRLLKLIHCRAVFCFSWTYTEAASEHFVDSIVRRPAKVFQLLSDDYMRWVGRLAGNNAVKVRLGDLGDSKERFAHGTRQSAQSTEGQERPILYMTYQIQIDVTWEYI